MPRRTKFRRRATRRPRRSGPSKAVKSYVRRAMKRVGELKHHTDTETAISISTAATIITNMLTIPIGTGVVQRLGNQVELSSCSVKFSIKSIDSPGNIMRVIWFVWKADSTDDVPQTDEILESTATLPWLSPLVADAVQRKKFTLLSDRTYALTTGVDAAHQKVGTLKLSFKGMKVDYDVAGAGTGSNLPMVLLVSDSAAATHPNYSHVTVWRFRDP